jgi:hypothetical protein
MNFASDAGRESGDALLRERFDRLESLLTMLVERQQLKDWYGIDDFSRLVGKAPFTVREWARLGRIHAEKRQSGRGKHCAWVISHTELIRFQREGLLPAPVAFRQPHQYSAD